jgi:hypothetical protein
MNHKTNLKAVLLLGVLMYVALSALFTYSFEQGPNNRNVSVDTKLNITNAPPTVLAVVIQNGSTNITLNAGSQRNITCFATIRDFNGGNTIENVTARFFHSTALWNSTDDNNTHYTNASGFATSGCALGPFDTYTRNVTCGFTLQYHANVGFWTCNVTAVDPYSFGNASRNNSLANTTYIDPLLALNVTTLIDYGDLATGDVSAAQQANVTNLGNLNINLSVRGYGNVSGDNLSFLCEVSNISIEYEKYNLIGGQDLATYTNLSGIATRVGGLTIAQQTNDSQRVLNSTYWVVQIPPGPFGRCNGTVVFQAEYST